jgi:hypothetical protein
VGYGCYNFRQRWRNSDNWAEEFEVKDVPPEKYSHYKKLNYLSKNKEGVSNKIELPAL